MVVILGCTTLYVTLGYEKLIQISSLYAQWEEIHGFELQKHFNLKGEHDRSQLTLHSLISLFIHLNKTATKLIVYNLVNVKGKYFMN